MVYTFTPEQMARLESCRVQFNRLAGKNWSIQKFISWTIKQAIEDTETAAAAVRIALPDGDLRTFKASANVH